MSDYHTSADISRGHMATMLGENDEQFVHVITSAICDVYWHGALDQGQLGDDVKPQVAIDRLRELADAIEAGEIT